MSKENIEKEDNTYSGEGMLYGVAAGTIIGAIITMFMGLSRFARQPLHT